MEKLSASEVTERVAAVAASPADAADKTAAYQPLAHLTRTAATLLASIEDPALHSLPPTRRLALLETAGPLVAFINTGFHRSRTGAKSMQLEEAGAVDPAFPLLRAMAAGYGVVADVMSRQSHSAETLALPLQRAIHYGSLVLLTYYRQYRPAPAGLWARLHRLYLTAAKHGAQNVLVPNPDGRHREHGSASGAYKRILLLAAMNPYGLRLQEQSEAFVVCERLAALSVIRKANGMMPAAGLLPVDVDSDRPPEPWRGDSLPRTRLVLDCRRACAIGVVGAEDGSDDRSAVSHPNSAGRLIARLLRSAATRKYPRRARTETAQVVIGLGRITDILLSSTEPDGAGSNVVPISTPLAQTAAFDTMETAGVRPAYLDVEVVESSATGCCLQASMTLQAEVGDVIAVWVDEGGLPSPKIGLIRWVKQTPSGAQLGVEQVGFGPISVQVQSTPRPGQRTNPVHAILLPGLSHRDRRAKLLVPRVAYPSSNRMTIRLHGREHTLDVEELTRTPCLQLFRTSGLPIDQPHPRAAV